MSDNWREGYRKEVNDLARESWWTLGKVIGFVLLPLLVLGLVGGVLGWFTDVASQPGRIVAKTVDADNVIYNYEWFKRQHEQIGAIGQQAKDAAASLDSYKKDAGPRTSWDYQTTAEYNRLNAVVLGLQNQRRNYVAEYNARAKMANRNIFMGRDLPPEEN